MPGCSETNETPTFFNSNGSATPLKAGTNTLNGCLKKGPPALRNENFSTVSQPQTSSANRHVKQSNIRRAVQNGKENESLSRGEAHAGLRGVGPNLGRSTSKNITNVACSKIKNKTKICFDTIDTIFGDRCKIESTLPNQPSPSKESPDRVLGEGKGTKKLNELISVQRNKIRVQDPNQSSNSPKYIPKNARPDVKTNINTSANSKRNFQISKQYTLKNPHISNDSSTQSGAPAPSSSPKVVPGRKTYQTLNSERCQSPTKQSPAKHSQEKNDIKSVVQSSKSYRRSRDNQTKTKAEPSTNSSNDASQSYSKTNRAQPLSSSSKNHRNLKVLSNDPNKSKEPKSLPLKNSNDASDEKPEYIPDDLTTLPHSDRDLNDHQNPDESLEPDNSKAASPSKDQALSQDYGQVQHNWKTSTVLSSEPSQYVPNDPNTQTVQPPESTGTNENSQMYVNSSQIQHHTSENRLCQDCRKATSPTRELNASPSQLHPEWKTSTPNDSRSSDTSQHISKDPETKHNQGPAYTRSRAEPPGYFFRKSILEVPENVETGPSKLHPEWKTSTPNSSVCSETSQDALNYAKTEDNQIHGDVAKDIKTEHNQNLEPASTKTEPSSRYLNDRRSALENTERDQPIVEASEVRSLAPDPSKLHREWKTSTPNSSVCSETSQDALNYAKTEDNQIHGYHCTKTEPSGTYLNDRSAWQNTEHGQSILEASGDRNMPGGQPKVHREWKTSTPNDTRNSEIPQHFSEDRETEHSQYPDYTYKKPESSGPCSKDCNIYRGTAQYRPAREGSKDIHVPPERVNGHRGWKTSTRNESLDSEISHHASKDTQTGPSTYSGHTCKKMESSDRYLKDYSTYRGATQNQSTQEESKDINVGPGRVNAHREWKTSTRNMSLDSETLQHVSKDTKIEPPRHTCNRAESSDRYLKNYSTYRHATQDRLPDDLNVSPERPNTNREWKTSTHNEYLGSETSQDVLQDPNTKLAQSRECPCKQVESSSRYGNDRSSWEGVSLHEKYLDCRLHQARDRYPATDPCEQKTSSPNEHFSSETSQQVLRDSKTKSRQSSGYAWSTSSGRTFQYTERDQSVFEVSPSLPRHQCYLNNLSSPPKDFKVPPAYSDGCRDWKTSTSNDSFNSGSSQQVLNHRDTSTKRAPNVSPQKQKADTGRQSLSYSKDKHTPRHSESPDSRSPNSRQEKSSVLVNLKLPNYNVRDPDPQTCIADCPAGFITEDSSTTSITNDPDKFTSSHHCQHHGKNTSTLRNLRCVQHGQYNLPNYVPSYCKAACPCGVLNQSSISPEVHRSGNFSQHNNTVCQKLNPQVVFSTVNTPCLADSKGPHAHPECSYTFSNSTPLLFPYNICEHVNPEIPMKPHAIFDSIPSEIFNQMQYFEKMYPGLVTTAAEGDNTSCWVNPNMAYTVPKHTTGIVCSQSKVSKDRTLSDEMVPILQSIYDVLHFIRTEMSKGSIQNIETIQRLTQYPTSDSKQVLNSRSRRPGDMSCQPSQCDSKMKSSISVGCQTVSYPRGYYRIANPGVNFNPEIYFESKCLDTTIQKANKTVHMSVPNDCPLKNDRPCPLKNDRQKQTEEAPRFATIRILDRDESLYSNDTNENFKSSVLSAVSFNSFPSCLNKSKHEFQHCSADSTQKSTTQAFHDDGNTAKREALSEKNQRQLYQNMNDLRSSAGSLNSCYKENIGSSEDPNWSFVRNSQSRKNQTSILNTSEGLSNISSNCVMDRSLKSSHYLQIGYPAQIIKAKRLTFNTIIIKWDLAESNTCMIKGYEIFVDGLVKIRYFSNLHRAAILCNVDAEQPHRITLYPLPKWCDATCSTSNMLLNYNKTNNDFIWQASTVHYEPEGSFETIHSSYCSS